MKSSVPRRVVRMIALAALAIVVGGAWWFARSNREVASAAPEAKGPASRAKSVAAIETPAPNSAAQLAPTDTAPSSRANASAHERELEFVFADGSPVSHATAALFDGANFASRGDTDDRGFATLDCASDSARALVVGADLAPNFAAVHFESGRTRVALATSRSLGGSIVAVGAKLDRRVHIEVASDRPWFDASALPESASKSVPSEWLDPLKRTLETGDDGHFRLRGVAEPWSGKLTLGRECTFIDVAAPATRTIGFLPTILVPALLDDLKIEVALRPKLTGRLVESVGGAPLARAFVGVGIWYSGSDHPWPMSAEMGSLPSHTDDDGRFELWAPETQGDSTTEVLSSRNSKRARATPSWPALFSVSLNVRRGGNGELATVDLRGATLPSGWDLGDIAVPSPRSLKFVVHDANGTPIAGARASFGNASAPTDAQGRGSITLPPYAMNSFKIGAAGWRTKVVATPTDLAVALDCTLERTNRLEIVVREADGSPARDLALAFDESPFEDDKIAWVDSMDRDNGANLLRHGDLENPWLGHTDANGRLLLTNVASRSQIVVRATDELEHELATWSVSIGADEWKTAEFTLDSAVLAFHGLVTDTQDLPMAGVSISVRASDPSANRRSHPVERTTDASGTFRIARLVPGTLWVGASKLGFASRGLEVDVQPANDSVWLKLTASRSLSIKAVDGNRREIAMQGLRIAWDHSNELLLGALPPSGYSSDEAPSDSASVEITVAGAHYVRQLAADAAELVVAVPTHGGAKFVGAPDSPRPIRVLVRDVDHLLAEQTAYFATDGGGSASLEPLLPGDYEARTEFASSGGSAATAAPRSIRFRVRAEETTTVTLEP